MRKYCLKSLRKNLEKNLEFSTQSLAKLIKLLSEYIEFLLKIHPLDLTPRLRHTACSRRLTKRLALFCGKVDVMLSLLEKNDSF